MSEQSNQTVNDTRQSLASVNNARKLAMKAAKAASSTAAKSGAGAKAAAAVGGGVAIKVIAIALLVLLVLGAIIAGTSGTQMSNTYYLTMKGSKNVNKPDKKDREAALTDKGFTQETTEKLIGVILEYKKESMSKTKDQMWDTYQKIADNPSGGIDSMDREKTEENIDIPESIANIDEGDFSGLSGKSNPSSEEEKINGEAIAAEAETYLGKGIKYGLGKGQLVCSTYVNAVLEHFKAGQMSGMVPDAAVKLPKDKAFKEIYRYDPSDSNALDMDKLQKAYDEMLPGDIILVGPLYSGSYHTKKKGKFSGSIGHVGIYLGDYMMIDCSSRWNGIGKASIKPNYDKNGAYPVVGKAIYSVYRAKNVKMTKAEKKAAEKAARKRWGSGLSNDSASSSESGSGKTISATEGERIAQNAIRLAKEHKSTGYDTSSQTWSGGISCHGFVAQVYKACGYKDVYNIIHTHKGFYKKPYGKEHLGGKYKVIYNKNGLKESQLQPGDIIIKRLKWANGYHTGIYLGNGRVADSTRPGHGPHVAKSFSPKYKHAVRVAPTGSSSGAAEETLPKKVSEILKNGWTIDGKRLSKTQCKNALYVWNALKKEGITDEGAAGVLGNLTQEHGFNTDDVKLKKSSVGLLGGLGMCQWIGGRRTKLLSEKNPYTIETQTAFMINELKTSYKAVYKGLKSASDVNEASELFRTKYEVGSGSEIRKRFARSWCKMLKGVSGDGIGEDQTIQTIGITQGDMDLLAAYSISLGNLMLTRQNTLEEFGKKWKQISKIFHDPGINPVTKFRKIKAIQDKMNEDEKKIFDCSALIQNWMRRQSYYTYPKNKVISSAALKKLEKKRRKLEGKWNSELQKKFENDIFPDSSIEAQFQGTWEEKYIPYRDINNKKIKVYVFDTDEHNAGQPNFEKDLEEKLKYWFSHNKNATFYKYTFKLNGEPDIDEKFKTNTYKYYRSNAVFSYDHVIETETTGGKIVKQTKTYGYMKPVIREKGIEEIMEDIFMIDPEEKYANAKPDDNAMKEWTLYREDKIKRSELSAKTKRWPTNREAVSDLSKGTTELLFDGSLPDAAIDINGDFDCGSASGSFISPLLCAYTTNTYGQFLAKRSYELHPGLDMATFGQGFPVYSCCDGVVKLAGLNGGYGYSVVVDAGGGITVRYAHMVSGSIKVKVGQKVKQKQVVGAVGNTGLSSGPHLHLEFRKNGNPDNPANYIKGLKYKPGGPYKMKW